MKIFLTPLLLSLCLKSYASPFSSSSSSSGSSDNIFTGRMRKEVCVIGGGAAGAYTAYELQNRGYDTVLFEPQDDLGGNCEILEVPSKLTPGLTYTVNAAVIIFSPRPAVIDFFNEFNAPTVNFIQDPNQQQFVYGPGFVAPVPPPTPQQQQAIAAALTEFATIANTPPYAGITVIPPLPDWDNLTQQQRDLLLEPYSDFVARNPLVAPLTPLISSLMQGFGFVETRPMWEIFAFGGPTFITQVFQGTFLTLTEGCQDIYNELGDRMLAADPTSLKLNTMVTRVKRKRRKVTLRATDAHGTRTSYRCDSAIVAFRPNGVDQTFLRDITTDEQDFFDDLGYNGYIPSVWEMDVGPALQAVGVSPNTALNFNFFQPVDVGIITLSKDQPQADYPYRLFYQPSEPADTPAKLAAVELQIISDLTAIGFINIKKLFLSNHVYAVKPQTEANTLEWTNFFNDLNSNNDRLFWTGSVPAGEGSENVWQYSLDLFDTNFPPKP